MRYIVLDTETTGLDPDDGHKIIEIGCVEILDRNITENTFHKYINPEREIDIEASKVHGLTLNNLKDKPIFSEIYDDFLEYVDQSPIIIHNAPFDVGFLKKEHSFLKDKKSFLDNEIIDSLKLARKKSPGKKNTLDALCERYSVDSSDRTLHGALLDARLLAHVYLKMTVGQNNFSDLTVDKKFEKINDNTFKDTFKIIEASDEEKSLHESYFK
ncbi:MAG: DNA polymerase III subunit epsilon [Gammaproteobacteria bacterium]